MPQKVEISYKTIVFSVIFLLSVWCIYLLKDIIFLVFVAFIFMSTLRPLTDWLEEKGIPRPLVILLLYAGIIVLLVFMGSSLLPLLVNETIHLSSNLPQLIRTYLPFLNIDIQTVTSQLAPLGENIVKVTFGLFGNLFSLFSLFVISFYLLMERKHLQSHLVSLSSEGNANKIIGVVRKVEDRLGAWVRGQLTLVIVIGVLTFIGLSILQIPYALPLAIIAGTLEVVPNIGPVVSSIPSILVALTVSPFVALLTAALYVVVQQFENHLIVPLVMKRVVGLPPIVTILALMIGARLSGISGALLSVPIVVTAETILMEVLKSRDSK